MTTPRTTSGLVAWLHELSKLKKPQDRGRLAALRRGLLLEPDQWYELYRVVPPRFLEGIGRAEMERRLTVAILFAAHSASFPPEELAERSRNLGESLRTLAKRQAQGAPSNADDPMPEPLKRRLDALLAAHPAELFEHLRLIVRLLKSKEVPIDWDQLLSDLRSWDREDRRVQWQWSRSFYVGPYEAEGGQPNVR